MCPRQLGYDLLSEMAGYAFGETTLAPSTEHFQGLSLYCLSGDLAGDLVASRYDCCTSA